MLRVLAVAALAYAVTWGAVVAAGLWPSPPWSFLLVLSTLTFPTAIALDHLSERLAPRGRFDGPRAVVALVAGIGVVWLHRIPSPAMVLLSAAVVAILLRRLAQRRLGVGPIAIASATLLALGYGVVWNLNYLVVLAAGSRLRDAELAATDVLLYRSLFGLPIDTIRGFFPLVRNDLAVRLLENAYVMLFTEIGLVVIAFLHSPRRLAGFFRALFACYLMGLAVFLVYPAVGPCIAMPESVQMGPNGALTRMMMASMAAEFAAVRTHGPLNGSAYFVALPSLHVAVATLVQCTLRTLPGHFWLVLPLNVLLVLSTVVLGYHYLLDVPAGMLVGIVAHRYLFAGAGRSPS